MFESASTTREIYPTQIAAPDGEDSFGRIDRSPDAGHDSFIPERYHSTSRITIQARRQPPQPIQSGRLHCCGWGYQVESRTVAQRIPWLWRCGVMELWSCGVVELWRGGSVRGCPLWADGQYLLSVVSCRLVVQSEIDRPDSVSHSGYTEDSYPRV